MVWQINVALGTNPHPERICLHNAVKSVYGIVQLLPLWAWSEPFVASAGQGVCIRELGEPGFARCSQGLLHLEVVLPTDACAVQRQPTIGKPATAQQRSNSCQVASEQLNDRIIV